MARSDVPTISSSECHWRFKATPGLQARHVEQVLDQGAQAPRLLADVLDDGSLLLGRGRLGEPQGIGQADQGRQRGAQIVRDRRQQRIAQPFGLHLQRRILRDLHVVGALECDGDQPGDSVEQPALFGTEQARACLGFDRHKAAQPHRRLQGQVQHGAGGQRIGSEPGRLAVVHGPLGDAQFDRQGVRCRAPQRARRRHHAPLVVGEQ